MSAQADGAGTSDGLADQAAQPVMDSAPCLSKPCLARPPTANRASRWRLEGLLCTDFSGAPYSRARQTLLRRQRPHLPRLPRLPPTGRPHRRRPRPTGLALSVAHRFLCSCQMYLVPMAPRSRLPCSCGATRLMGSQSLSSRDGRSRPKVRAQSACSSLLPARPRSTHGLSLSAAGPTEGANGGSGGDHQHHVTLAARRAPAIRSKAMGTKQMRSTNIMNFFSKSSTFSGFFMHHSCKLHVVASLVPVSLDLVASLVPVSLASLASLGRPRAAIQTAAIFVCSL